MRLIIHYTPLRPEALGTDSLSVNVLTWSNRWITTVTEKFLWSSSGLILHLNLDIWHSFFVTSVPLFLHQIDFLLKKAWEFLALPKMREPYPKHFTSLKGCKTERDWAWTTPELCNIMMVIYCDLGRQPRPKSTKLSVLTCRSQSLYLTTT